MNIPSERSLEKLTRKSKRIQRALAFWTRLANITRFGLHGFVLWRIRRAYEQAVEFNRVAQIFNRRERKERRRAEAMRRR